MVLYAGRHAVVLVAWILAALIVASPAYAADVIYKYEDQQGVTHYTDQRGLIPEQYRSRAQRLDTSKAPVTILPAPPQQPQTPKQVQGDHPAGGQQEPLPFYSSWLGQLSQLPISTRQIALGLGGLGLLVAMLTFLKLTTRPILRLLLKTALVALLIVGVYGMYLLSLSATISKATGDPAEGKATDKALSPLENLKDVTIDRTKRTVEKMNRATQQEERTLRQIESNP